MESRRLTMIGIYATLLMISAGCGGEERAETTGGRTSTGASEASQAITAEVEVEGDTWGIAASPGAVWVQVDPPVDALVRIDTGSKEITAKVARGRNAAFDGVDLWVAGPKLRRVDPATGARRGAAAIDSVRVATGLGAVWVQPLTATRAVLLRVDPATLNVVARIPVRGCVDPREFVVAYGSIWLACMGSNTLARIDARTNEVLATIPVGAAPHHVVAGAGAVWANNIDGANVARIDPSSNKVVARTPMPGGGIGLAAGGGFVWGARDAGIAQIDPRTNTVVGELLVGPARYYGIAYVDGALWVTTVAARRVLRLDPEKASRP